MTQLAVHTSIFGAVAIGMMGARMAGIASDTESLGRRSGFSKPEARACPLLDETRNANDQQFIRAREHSRDGLMDIAAERF